MNQIKVMDEIFGSQKQTIIHQFIQYGTKYLSINRIKFSSIFKVIGENKWYEKGMKMKGEGNKDEKNVIER